MNKAQEKVLVAVLCGLVMAVAAAFAVQPSLATPPAPHHWAMAGNASS